MSENENVIRRDDNPAAALVPAASAPAAPQLGSEQQPYVPLATKITTYQFEVVDEDVTTDEELASFTLTVTWHKIAWRGRTVWIPHDIAADGGHGRGIRTGQTVNASFSSVGNDDLVIYITWNNTLSADTSITKERAIGGHLDRTQENLLSLSATVPVEGVSVAGQAASKTSSKAAVHFEHKYCQGVVESESTASVEIVLKSNTNGVEHVRTTAMGLDILGRDSTLKDIYGSWAEGDLDLAVKEKSGSIFEPLRLR